MKIVFKILPLISILLVQVFAGPAAHAAGITINNTQDLVNKLCSLFSWMFTLLIILSSIMVLVGGYIYVTAGGDTEKVKTATKTLTFAAVGVVVGLAAKGFPNLVATLFGATAGGC